MLSICPNDNIGVRHYLPSLWFDAGDYLSVVRLCKKYPDDYSPELNYGYPLALILLGELDKAKPILEKAKVDFPLVAKALKKKKHIRLKSKFPGTITVGGADQAYEYWSLYGTHWLNSSVAMACL
mgnify:CR=1 FL=1